MNKANRHSMTGQHAAESPDTLENLEVRLVVFGLRENTLQALFCAESPKPDQAADWELPGSRVPIDQSLEETATNCLLRLTGLREVYLEQLYTYGDVSRAAPDLERLISVVYFAIVPGNANSSHKNKDAASAKWFPVEALPPLAMDHQEVAVYALRRLRYKLEYTAVGFQLLPEQFSLTELQKTYEMILGERLDKRNFRRRILAAGIIEETTQKRSGEGRPARLYRYRPDAVAEVKARRLFP